ncbi:MAG: hypothetical protein ACK4NR_08405 [Micavibrio sp.]
MRFYLAVAVACGCVMALQILQSRIFSVVTWYHLSFLTISIAMFGLTLGALHVYRETKGKTLDNLPSRLADSTRLFGYWAAASLIVQLCIPIVHSNLMGVLVTLPLVASITTIAYFYAGQLVSLCLTRSGRPAARVYAADMIGASAGCLVALALMQTVDAPSAILIVAGMTVATSMMFLEKFGQRKTSIVALLLVAFGIVNSMMPSPPVYPLWTKSALVPRNIIFYEDWNAISRVTVIDSAKYDITKRVFLWGASPTLPADIETDFKILAVDGAAITPVNEFDGKSWDKLKWLEYDITNIAHFAPNIKSIAIVGAGGGRDILSALYFGAENVVALDINNIQVDLLTKIPDQRSYTNLWDQPGLRVINAEARNWFTHNTEKFDAIQISLIDTWVSAGAGAYALTENSLYTTDAWKIFLNDLNERGLLTVSRWHFKESYNDLGRLTSMTTAALLDMGVSAPWRNVFIAHTGRIASIVVGRDALTPAQLDGLHEAAEKFQYEILASPRLEKDDIVNNILRAESRSGITKVIKDLPFDLEPPSDERPFFFNQARLERPLEVIRQATASNMKEQNLRGHAVATLNLYIIILFSIIVSLLVLILPYRKALTNAEAPFIKAGTCYFMLIGLGFMFVEIPMMQIMSMFLGHPVYGLGIILFSLILSTGIGSFVSDKFVLSNNKRIVIWSLMIAGYIVLLSGSIHQLTNSFIAADLTTRIAVSLAMIFPAGLMMGFAFPTGMKLTSDVSEELTPWFWGINGAAGVTASALAMAISIKWGLNVTLLTGAACYALLCLPALIILKISKNKGTA